MPKYQAHRSKFQGGDPCVARGMDLLERRKRNFGPSLSTAQEAVFFHFSFKLGSPTNRDCDLVILAAPDSLNVGVDRNLPHDLEPERQEVGALNA